LKVLFVYSNHIGDVLPAPPIGLSYIASATEDAGHEVRFVDLFLVRCGYGRLGRELRAFAPDVVAFSVRNIDNVVHQRLVQHLERLKGQVAFIRQQSKAVIVLGGSAISILGSRILDHVDADIAVSGEGEEVFPALLAEMAAGHTEYVLPGVHVRGGAIPSLSPLPAVERCSDFGPSGMERWVDWRSYERWGATWPIQCKRGCPNQCTYCSYPAIEGSALRMRSIEDVVTEISRVADKVGPRCFEFIDSVFNLPGEYAAELCERIIQARLDIHLTAMGVNPRGLSAELLSLMKRAGFNSLMVTPESANNEVLARMRKGFTQEEVIRAARLVRESGLPSLWFFMLGAPGETQETAEETIVFAEEHLNFRHCLPVFTTGIRILPGTVLAAEAVAEGYLEREQDLTEPIFYFSPQVSEQWLLQRVNQAIAKCPAVVHAAEDPASTLTGRLASMVMHMFGVVPPYWRFYPRFLSLPFVHRSRLKK